MRVTVSPRAYEQLAEIIDWWKANRPAARTKVEDVFDRALQLLGEHPHIGMRYKGDERYRVYRLKGTPYRVYYVVDEQAGQVQVDAVWSSMRGRGPDLG